MKVHFDFKKNKPLIFIPGERKGEWVALPDRFVITEWDSPMPYDLSVTFKVSVENGVEIEKFEATKKGVEITSAGLRKINFGELLADAIDFAGMNFKDDGKGSLEGSLLKMNEKRYSEDVKKHATKKRRKNSVKHDDAKRIADHARRLIDQGDPNWAEKTWKAFNITRATMNRRFEMVKFKPAEHKQKRKKGKK